MTTHELPSRVEIAQALARAFPAIAQRLESLRERQANRPARIDNSQLKAGAPMYYYCASCGQLTDVLPEEHREFPRKLCAQCQELEDLGAAPWSRHT